MLGDILQRGPVLDIDGLLEFLEDGAFGHFIRMIQAPMVTRMLAQKIARHPQDCTASSGSRWAPVQASAPSTVPRAAPTITKDDKPAASADGCGFGQQGRAAGLFGAGAEALQKAQGDEQEWRPNAEWS